MNGLVGDEITACIARRLFSVHSVGIAILLGQVRRELADIAVLGRLFHLLDDGSDLLFRRAAVAAGGEHGERK